MSAVAPAPARVGWCPGVLAPMASGDGLIVRVKPRGARLTCGQAWAIALASRTCGSGWLDVTSRANLQIRGISQETLPRATAMLDDAGLIDSDPGAEAARNVVSSPLAGLDPAAVIDIRTAVAALEARLAESAALHVVPAKFSVVVDDGGRFGLADVTADIRFEAFSSDAGPTFAVRLGGAEDEAAGYCGPEDVATTALALIDVFLAEGGANAAISRMRDLVGRIGAAAILRAAHLDLCRPPARPASARFERFVGLFKLDPTRSRLGRSGSSAEDAPLPEGWGDTTARQAGVPSILGVAAPFGRLSADQLDLLAVQAGEGGATELRLTPWRAILIPGLRRDVQFAMADACALAGLIVDPADPRLRVAACTGAPGCHRATTPVLDHAARLTSRLNGGTSESGILLHVSGCGKGCAHQGKAPLTLVADNGCYSVVVDGGASDRPILHGLGFEEAEACVKASARMEPQA